MAGSAQQWQEGVGVALTQVDAPHPLHMRERDAFDQAPQDVDGLVPDRGFLQQVREGGDFGMVEVGEVRMQADRRGLRGFKLGLKAVPFRLQAPALRC